VRKSFLSFWVACCAFAGEHAILQNGFRIEVQRHEAIGAMTRLYTAHGTLDLPSADIARFELEDYIPPQPKMDPAPPQVMAPVVPADPKQLVDDAANRHGIRPEFARSVASAESAFRPDAVSPKGATGLMQLMPGTAAELGANPKDPAENADAGVRYLKQLLLKYKDSKDAVRLALAAYNAGPGAVDRYGNIPPYRETQAYVEKVIRKYLAEMR
jgi:hypothetical protein